MGNGLPPRIFGKMPIRDCDGVDIVRAHYLIQCVADDDDPLLPASQALWQRFYDKLRWAHGHVGCQFCRPIVPTGAVPPCP